MPKKPSFQSYNSVAKLLHWLIALAIVGMLALGWIMATLPKGDPEKFALFQWHKSIGITILLLSLARLAWRFTYTAPPLPASMAHWEKIAAQGAHILFYILIIGMPLTGWIIVSSSAMNVPTYLYGVIPWPNLPVLPTLENKREIGHAFDQVHDTLAFVILGLLILHAGAAWKHHLINRDDVLLRMAPKFMTRPLNWIRGRKLTIFFALTMFGATMASSQAFAKPWAVDYDQSKLGFVGMQGDTSFNGAFKTFQAMIDFDPAHPETGKIAVIIDTSSATAGSSERDDYLPQPDWFDVMKFPQAQFASTSIRAAKSGANCFEAAGALTIKGVAKPITLPFCLTQEGDHTRAQGRVTILRTDFNIGGGQWANEMYVKRSVDVVLDIAAK